MPSPLLALTLTCLLHAALAIRAPMDKPNIVMMFVDDLGYGDLGFTGHPTTKTPNLDQLAYTGKILTSWYSGCSVCSGSRAALMTGRQYVRLGVPGVFPNDVNVGLNINETTIADQLKKAGYATAIMGKWHLGQRVAYLPANRGFDKYLGIPFSDDMGEARATPCPPTTPSPHAHLSFSPTNTTATTLRRGISEETWEAYVNAGLAREAYSELSTDPGAALLPLVYQEHVKNATGGTSINTTVLEQPLDFSTLDAKYNQFVQEFVQENKDNPFFLYMPFSHVHTTAANQPQMQYAGCAFKNTTKRGMFGDALAEADWIVGNLVATLRDLNLMQNTLLVFTGDNGPWMVRNQSGGSTGLFTGRASNYWNVGKGSTWEGGIREAAFVHWEGVISPGVRTSEVVSSLDFFPTISKIVGVPLPEGRVYDGKDASQIFLSNGTSQHDFLFFYNSNTQDPPFAVRYGSYKAHWRTAPGLSGCTSPDCVTKYYPNPPLLFNVDVDPSEAYPLTQNNTQPTDPVIAQVIEDIQRAYKSEVASMTFGTLVPVPDGPGEGPGKYAVCCSRAMNCDCNGAPSV